MANKPKVFIGSSVEGLTVAYAVQQNLSHIAESTVWDQGVFELSQVSIESLTNVVDRSDFGIFVFTPDDVINIRGVEHLSVRDNILFELGLFIGKLGRSRTFIIEPQSSKLHIPTDLLGVATGKYEPHRSDGSMQAATGPVCNDIRNKMSTLGPIHKDTDNLATDNVDREIDNTDKEAVPESPKPREEFFEIYAQGETEKALEVLRKQEIDPSDSLVLYENQVWQVYCRLKAAQEDPYTIVNDFVSSIKTSKAYLEGATILYNRDYIREAYRIIEQGLVDFPENKILLLSKSDILNKDDKVSEAIEILSTKLQDMAISYTRLASVHLQENELKKALEVIHTGYNKFPNDETIMFNYSEILSKNSDYNSTLYFLNKLVNRFPSNTQYLGYLGNVCLTLELYDKALVYYQEALSLDPKASWVLANIGNIFNRQGFYSEAKKNLKSSIAIYDENEYAIRRMAEVMSNKEKEESKYNELLKEGKRSVEARNNILDIE